MNNIGINSELTQHYSRLNNESTQLLVLPHTLRRVMVRTTIKGMAVTKASIKDMVDTREIILKVVKAIGITKKEVSKVRKEEKAANLQHPCRTMSPMAALNTAANMQRPKTQSRISK